MAFLSHDDGLEIRPKLPSPWREREREKKKILFSTQWSSFVHFYSIQKNSRLPIWADGRLSSLLEASRLLSKVCSGEPKRIPSSWTKYPVAKKFKNCKKIEIKQSYQLFILCWAMEWWWWKGRVLSYGDWGPVFDSQRRVKYFLNISVFTQIFCFGFWDTCLGLLAILSFCISCTTC